MMQGGGQAVGVCRQEFACSDWHGNGDGLKELLKPPPSCRKRQTCPSDSFSLGRSPMLDCR